MTSENEPNSFNSELDQLNALFDAPSYEQDGAIKDFDRPVESDIDEKFEAIDRIKLTIERAVEQAHKRYRIYSFSAPNEKGHRGVIEVTLDADKDDPRISEYLATGSLEFRDNATLVEEHQEIEISIINEDRQALAWIESSDDEINICEDTNNLLGSFDFSPLVGGASQDFEEMAAHIRKAHLDPNSLDEDSLREAVKFAQSYMTWQAPQIVETYTTEATSSNGVEYDVFGRHGLKPGFKENDFVDPLIELYIADNTPPRKTFYVRILASPNEIQTSPIEIQSFILSHSGETICIPPATLDELDLDQLMWVNNALNRASLAPES